MPASFRIGAGDQRTRNAQVVYLVVADEGKSLISAWEALPGALIELANSWGHSVLEGGTSDRFS